MKTRLRFVLKLMPAVSLSLAAVMFVCGGLAFAETAQPAQTADGLQFVATVSQALTSDPGGRKIGDLYVNAPVRVSEVRGDWSRVSVEGWVRTRSLSSPGKRVDAKDATTINDSGFFLDRFTVRNVRESGLPSRVYLTLFVKNNTGKPVYRWKGELVAKDLEGKVLFSETIADDKANMQYGATRSVAFSWEGNERPFEPLRAAENRESTIKLELLKLQLISD